MKTITINYKNTEVKMFKVKASLKVAIIQAEQKLQTVALMHGFELSELSYSIN